MSYQIEMISPDGHEAELGQWSSGIVQLLNHGLKRLRIRPIGEHDGRRAATLEVPLTQALGHMMQHPSLYDTENTAHGDYEDAVMLTAELWRACRLNPEHILKINY